MKFRIKLSPNQEKVPFNYARQLCGVFHKWLGPNDLHDIMSLYSLSWLRGGKAQKGGLNFPSGANWEIGIFDDEIAERLIKGLLFDKEVIYGMKVRKVDRLSEPDFSEPLGRSQFKAGSPVLIRKVEDDMSRTHLTYKDDEHAQYLKKVMVHKMQEAGLGEEHQEVRLFFDPEYPKAKTKLVDIKGIKNRASLCPVIVEGTVQARKFAWTVGAGELTGVGFGSLVA